MRTCTKWRDWQNYHQWVHVISISCSAHWGVPVWYFTGRKCRYDLYPSREVPVWHTVSYRPTSRIDSTWYISRGVWDKKVSNSKWHSRPLKIQKVTGRLMVETRQGHWHRPMLSCGVVCVRKYLVVLTKHRLVTDRRTDRDTHDIYRASMASRCKIDRNTHFISTIA